MLRFKSASGSIGALRNEASARQLFVNGSRQLSTLRRPKEGKVRDEWESAEFAEAWTSTGHILTNPARDSQLRLLSKLVANRFKEGDKVLDIGCGSGLSSAPVLASLPVNVQAHGVDGNEAMLKLCKDNSPTLTTHKVPFEELGSFSGLGEFQHIFTVQALHEVDDETKLIVFDFAKKSLSENGAFYIWDRFQYDGKESKFLDDYKGLWDYITTETSSTLNQLSWEEYNQAYLEIKDDFASEEDDYIQMLDKSGFQAQVLHKLFNRSLIVARHK